MDDSVTIDLEEGSSESTDNSHLCLVGKVLASKLLNRTTVSKIIQSAWKTREEIVVSPWPDNVFLFRFGNLEDRLKVLREAPWSIIGNFLVLQPLKMGCSISEMDFSFCPFWVQVHGLPMDHLTRRNGQINAESLGQLIGVEVPHDGLLLHRSFLRLRVELDVSKPILRGFMMKRKDPNTLNITEKWVDFKYEKLSDYCYDCSRIGHDNKSCKFTGREAGRNSEYGPHLKIGVAPKLNLPVDFIQKQIDEMEARIRPLLGRKTQTMTVESKVLVARKYDAREHSSQGQFGTLEGVVQGPLSCSVGTEPDPLVYHSRLPRGLVPTSHDIPISEVLSRTTTQHKVTPFGKHLGPTT
ncbi:Uncharacterized protein LOK49_Contig153G00003 [Camellia lanceoleosa]|nr:Uncharacterized protein LOK49_Contig153G00003 [Camellia lanceoleosa]